MLHITMGFLLTKGCFYIKCSLSSIHEKGNQHRNYSAVVSKLSELSDKKADYSITAIFCGVQNNPIFFNRGGGRGQILLILHQGRVMYKPWGKGVP